MKTAAQIVSWLALAGTLLPALLFAGDQMSLDSAKAWMLAAMVAWFVATPCWMERKRDE